MSNKETGWKCPKCKRVYSPSIKECKECNNTITETINNNESMLLG